MASNISRRISQLESRRGGSRFDGWTDSQIVERINEICGLFRSAGIDAPLLDPSRPDPEMLDRFITQTKTSLSGV